ncbi:hypothetical protein ODR93_25180, partial [Escherichia coli]|nr:hypothetical protein [Escherichia coli]
MLAGRVGDAAGRTGLAGSDAFPDSFENEASLISPLRTVDMGELKWFTEFGHLNRGDMLTSEQHRCHNEKKKFQRRV